MIAPGPPDTQETIGTPSDGSSDDGARNPYTLRTLDRPSADDATTSKSQRAYHWIKERISDGRFTPGYRLVLGQIAGQLNVSVVPVREAIRLLEAEGLVSYVRNVGAQVTMIDSTAYADVMYSLGVVEAAATACALEHLTESDLVRARHINAELSDCLDHFVPHRFTELNSAFHATLFRRCPNHQLVELVDRCWSRISTLRDSTFGFVPGRAQDSVAEHGELLDLIENGAAPDAVEQKARAHRHATLEAVLAYQRQRSSTTPETQDQEDT